MGTLLDEFIGDVGKREEDLAMLHDILDHPDIRDDEHDAFGDMLDRLGEWQHELTAKQRAWLRSRCVELDLRDVESCGCDKMSEESCDICNPNRRVPRGREVPIPEVLRALPKRPPRRR